MTKYHKLRLFWEAKVPQSILEFAKENSSFKLNLGMLRILSDFVAAEIMFDIELVGMGLIEVVLPFLNAKTPEFKELATRILSNIASGGMDLKLKLSELGCLEKFEAFLKAHLENNKMVRDKRVPAYAFRSWKAVTW